jgi:putative oxidoreductase
VSPTRRLARPLLASIFLSSAAGQIKDQSYIAGAIREAGLAEPEKLAKTHVYANLVGGVALATNRFPRLAALGLAANLIPTTLVGHAFWSAPAEQKQMQQINFFKNVSLLGGLLLAAADTGGRESLPHAVGRVSRRTARKAEKAGGRAKKKLPTS